MKENKKFELYKDDFDDFSFVNPKDAVEDIANNPKKSAEDLQNDTLGPINISLYR